VRNEEVLLRVKGQRDILHEIINGRLTGLVRFCVDTAFYNRLGRKDRRVDRSGRRRGRRRRKLLDDLKEGRRCCRLKEGALDRTMWRACFGRGFGPAVND